MASMLALAAVLAITVLPLQSDAQSACPVASQPVIRSISPPAGTTGTDPLESSNYTISGSLLNEVASIRVFYVSRSMEMELMTQNRMGDSESIAFNIEDARLRPEERVNATVSVIPIDINCAVTNLTITLFSELDISFGFQLLGQPGAITVLTSSSCVPGECGDNSTSFDLIVGDIRLERLSTVNTTLKYVGRFPNFQSSGGGAGVMIVTQYQTFRLAVFIAFTLSQPGPIMIMPGIGQRGTRASITGVDLLDSGPVGTVAISQVRLGASDADIIDTSVAGRVQIRARTGNPGRVTVLVNSTVTYDGRMFDGAYVSLVDGWLQLADGRITNIIPQAAQSGRMITLCGMNLLGNGTSIITTQHGNNTFTQAQSTPSPASPPLPGSECFEVEIPSSLQPNIPAENTVILTSDTGSIVESVSTFTVTSIESVTPGRGQAGTIVTIRGQSLLSGYPSATPTVLLTGIPAMLLQHNSSEIVVRVATPPTLNPIMINSTATIPPPQIIGVPGDVIIEVPNPFNSSLRFNVSSNASWQYEVAGEIDQVTPNFGQNGTLVTINGTNLLAYGNSLTHATVGGANATVLAGATNDVIQLVIPDSSTTGPVDIILFSDTGANVRGSGVFQYRERGIITSTFPSQGQNGTYVTITGTNLFGHGQNVTSVIFGDVPTTIDYETTNNTMIGVRVQANTNTEDVVVPIFITADTGAGVTSVMPIWTFLVQGQIAANQPQEGQVGTRIEITGLNLLGGGERVNEVFLDGVSATVVSNSSTRIVVVMGSLVTRQADFFPGEIFIMADTGAIVTGGTYTHRESGIITSYSPTRGRRGTFVTITGTNLLGFGTSVSSLEIAGVGASVLSFNSTTVVARAGMGGAGQTGPVRLLVDTGATITSTMNFTYDEPGVTSQVFPARGAEGTGLRVSGSGLLPANVQLTNITIGGIPVSRVVTASNQEVSVIVGPAPPSNIDMAPIVIDASDGSFVDGAFFSFINLSISVIGLSSGQDGTLIQVSLPNATEFSPNFNLRATVNDQSARIVNVDMDQRRITVMVPRAQRQGTFLADVAVEGQNGLIARLRDGFMYLSEGLICDVDPTSGQNGTVVILRGENLLGGGNVTMSATVAGRTARVLQSADDMVMLQLTEARMDDSTSFPLRGDVILTADTGALVLRLNIFTLVAPGRIAQVSPGSGQNGTRVMITGTNLLQGNLNISSVTLAGVVAVVTGTPSDTLISIEAGASSQQTQPLPVVVTLSSGATITSASGITFQYLAPGTITEVDPNVGTVGTMISITGSNLLQGGTRANMVLLGGVRANISTATDTTIAVTAERGPTGIGDVVIISDTGSTLTGRRLWTYEALGSIDMISPELGQQGTAVTIMGESLLGTSASRFFSCTLAGIPGMVDRGSAFDDTVVTCIAGPNPDSETMSVSGPVQLVTDTGVVLISSENITFTYYQASISSVAPTQGNNGTVVTIAGENLFGSFNSSFSVSRVLFGTQEATIVSSSPDEIIVRVGLSTTPTINDTVRVESSSGSFLELNNAWNYTVPGMILTLSQLSGVPGDTVTLSGGNLIPPRLTTTPRVVIGQTEAFGVQVINSSTIQFRAGTYQNSDTPGQGLPVQIIHSTGETIISTTNVTFTYNATAGEVTSVIPIAGSAGTFVIINGTNLPNMSDIMVVTLAGVQATIMSASPTRIEVTAGPTPSSDLSGPVFIETTTGSVLGLAGNAWEYYPTIMSNSVSPTTGQNGTRVTIDLSSITNLPNVFRVNLTSIESRIVSLDEGVLIVEARQSSSSTPLGDISIELEDGTEIIILNSWSYQLPVSVTAMTPQSGYFNTSVVITGSNFRPNSVPITSVYLAGVETTIEMQSNTRLELRVSEERLVSSDLIGPAVIVAESGATYSSIAQLNFTYIRVQVVSVSPTSGTRGTLITLTGIGLLAGGMNIDLATFSGVPADVQTMNNTVITLAAGPSPMTTSLGNVTYIMNTGARVFIQNMWRYIEPGQITSVTPSSGALGTIVSITGSSLFGGGTRATVVMLNTQMTTDILVNFDSFIQVIAAGSTGALQPGNVRVISDTSAITESSGDVLFTYIESGSITSTTPASGQNGTTVTITGQRLHSNEGIGRVFLAGIEARVISVTDSNMDTTIVVEAGRPRDLGSFQGPVVVHSNFNTTSISSQNFTYNTEGVIFSVSPRQGRNGTIISLEGENMLGGGTRLMSVLLAGIEATMFNGTSSAIFIHSPLGPNTNAALTGDITLISNSNAHVTRVDGWTFVQQGRVNSIAPPEGQYGTRVDIIGQNLLSGGSDINLIQFDDVFVTVTSANETVVSGRIEQPQDGAEFVTSSITMISDFGGVLYQEINWTFMNQSNITSLDPPSGFGETPVVISGRGLLGGGMEIRSASVAGIAATVMSSGDTEVMIQTGLNSGGEIRTGPVILESDTGALSISSDDWRYDEECPNNTYGTVGNCLPCDSQCAGCFGPSNLNCTACENFAILLDGGFDMECVEMCPNISTLDNVCVDACELNQYARVDTLQNITFCYNCSSLCDPDLGCSGPEPSQCQGCQFFLDTVNQTCVDECSSDAHFVNETKECRPCHSQCLNGCFGPSDAECFDCVNLEINAFSIFGDNSETMFNDVCRETCPSLFFQQPNSSFCTPCDPSCSENCTGPTPFDCMNCRNVSFVYPNGTRKCLLSCEPNHYQDVNNECQRCHPLCLPSGGCTGPNSADCNFCSLSQGSSTNCVSECSNSTYFIRNSTRSCERCSDACGTRGCTEEGPLNCLQEEQNSFSAGSGTIAVVVILILILVAIVVLLVVAILYVLLKRGDRSSIYKVAEESKGNEKVRYSKHGIQDGSIALTAIATKTPVTSNPTFMEASTELYELDMPETANESSGIDALYNEATAVEEEEPKPAPFPGKSEPMSASQDNLYTDMDNLPPSSDPLSPASKEMSSSQDNLYTDMAPGEIQSPPPAKELSASQDVLYTDMDNLPPTEAQSPPPSLPPKEISASQDNLYTDMDGLPPSETAPAIAELPASQDVYTDMEPILPSKPEKLPPKPEAEKEKEKETKRPAPAPRGLKRQESTDNPPALPAKPVKPVPPGPPSPIDNGQVYTDMQGGITEVFINAGATQEDVYDDVVEGLPSSTLQPPPQPSTLPASSPPQRAPAPLEDSMYEDTDTALASVAEYRKSFGAGSSSSSNLPLLPKKPSNNRLSAPALPSQPIPKKRQSLPQTPLQQSLSSSSITSTPISPSSSVSSRPHSVFSEALPEEESLYDDIQGIAAEQPLMNKTRPTSTSKSGAAGKSKEPAKKQAKQKKKK